MSTIDVFEAVAGSGIRDTHFFNGRLLTAGDLRTTQDAVIARDRQLARAMGPGVAHGLVVSVSDPGTTGSGARPTLHVTAGLALSRRGDALELGDAVDLALIPETDSRLAAAGEFSICPPPRPATALTNLGLYVLTIAPASWLEGLAPMSELRTDGVGSTCGRRYELDGVQFGLTRVDLTSEPSDAPADANAAAALRAEIAALGADLDTRLGQLLGGLPIAGLADEVERKLSRLRSGVAHLCLGTEERRALLADPLGSASQGQPGGLERLFRDGTLRDSEVPLALLYWSVRGVEFADLWSVRRPPAPAPSGAWSAHASARRAAEGMLTWLQFQQQLDDLGARSAVSLPDMRAVDWFRYLPPVGVAPLAAAAGTTGVDVQRFFDSMTARAPEFVNGARLPALLRRAWRYPVIDPAEQELVWRYLVRENVAAFNAGGARRPRTCLLFASGHVPFAASAQFDLARWDYANYSSQSSQLAPEE